MLSRPLSFRSPLFVTACATRHNSDGEKLAVDLTDNKITKRGHGSLNFSARDAIVMKISVYLTHHSFSMQISTMIGGSARTVFRTHNLHHLRAFEKRAICLCILCQPRTSCPIDNVYTMNIHFTRPPIILCKTM